MHESRLCQFYRARPLRPASSANKVIFPNLLRQKRDTLPVLVLSTQSRQDPGQGRGWAFLFISSPLPAQSLGLFSKSCPIIFSRGAQAADSGRWLARGEPRGRPGILGARERLAETTSQRRGRERGCCRLKFTGVGAVIDILGQWA